MYRGALLLTLAVPASAQQRLGSVFEHATTATILTATPPTATLPTATLPTATIPTAPTSTGRTAVDAVDAVPVDAGAGRALAMADTGRRRPVAIEYSDWYGRRLKIRQITSWAMLPLFAAQYAAGQQLIDKGRFGAPSWARNSHAPLATTIGVLFGVNTLTGAWNLWDARKDPAARGWRTAHAVLMLVADAGFAITPAFVNDDGGTDRRYESNLRTHRNVAIASMSVATVSWLLMRPPFRHE